MGIEYSIVIYRYRFIFIKFHRLTEIAYDKCLSIIYGFLLREPP